MIDIADIIKDVMNEALTIPADKAGPVEKKLRSRITDREFRQRYPKFQYHDILVKCCRNDEKSGLDQKQLELVYIAGLPNIMDMFDVYDKARQSYKTQRLDKKIKIERADGKAVVFDPIRDFARIGRMNILKDFVDKFDRLVNSDDSIQTSFEKYAVLADERKDIRLICWNENVMVWGTRRFEPAQKFAVQLWQNIDTIDSAGEYGHPERQCPYCTHAKSHWDRHADKNPDYEQFWYLSIPEDFGQLVKGDLNNPAVVKLFNKMKGIGPDSICAQNDSKGDWCDRGDTPIAEYDLTPHDIEEEGPMEVEDPDGDTDEDGYRETTEIEIDFNGFLDDVCELDNKFFGQDIGYRSPDRQEWESDSGYRERKALELRHAKTTKPLDDMRYDGKAFNPDEDIWRSNIVIDRSAVDVVDGKTVLKYRYPKSIDGKITVRNIEKLDSFSGFPEKYTGYNCGIVFKDCGRLDFSDFPISTIEKDGTITFNDCDIEVYDILGKFTPFGDSKISLFIKGEKPNIKISSGGRTIGGLENIRAANYDKGGRLDLTDLQTEKFKCLDIRGFDDVIGLTGFKIDKMYINWRYFEKRRDRECEVGELVVDFYKCPSFENTVKNVAAYCRNFRFDGYYEKFRIDSISALDGLPFNSGLARQCVVGNPECRIIYHAYQNAEHAAFDENGFFRHDRIPSYAHGQLYNGIRLRPFVGGDIKYSAIDEDRLMFFDDDGMVFGEYSKISMIYVDFRLQNGGIDERFQNFLMKMISDGSFPNCGLFLALGDFRVNGVDFRKFKFKIRNERKDTQYIDIENCLFDEIQSDASNMVISVKKSKISKFIDYLIPSKLTFTDSSVGFVLRIGNTQTSFINCDIYFSPDYSKQWSDDAPASRRIAQMYFPILKDGLSKNSRFHIRTQSEYLEVRSPEFFNLHEKFEKTYIEGERIKNLIADVYNISQSKFKEDAPIKLNCMLKQLGSDAETVELKNFNENIQFLSDVDFGQAVQRLEISFAQFTSKIKRLDFKNSKNIKRLVLGYTSSQFSLDGMPYFEEVQIASPRFVTAVLKKELDMYFDKAGDVYKMKKEFVVDGHLRFSGLNESVEPLPGYTYDDVVGAVGDFIQDRISEYGIDAKIIDIRLHGSRLRGDFREDSDLDAVVQYEGPDKEYHMFNILNDEPRLEIDGVVVDVNPIRKEESGDMREYMRKSFEYDADRKNAISESQPENINYVALKLDRQSREKLMAYTRKTFGHDYGKLYCDHITLAYGADQVEKFDFDFFGETVDFEIWNIVYDESAVAAVVDMGDIEYLGVNNEYPHITMATADGVRPVYSNDLIKGHFTGMNDSELLVLDRGITLRGAVEPVMYNRKPIAEFNGR